MVQRTVDRTARRLRRGQLLKKSGLLLLIVSFLLQGIAQFAPGYTPHMPRGCVDDGCRDRDPYLSTGGADIPQRTSPGPTRKRCGEIIPLQLQSRLRLDQRIERSEFPFGRPQTLKQRNVLPSHCNDAIERN